MAKRGREDSPSSQSNDGAAADARQRSHSIESAAHTPKYALLDSYPTEQATMRCVLPPHKPLSFQTYAEYETHYQQFHTNRCTDCQKNFPTAHFLELHIAENHDPIVASRRDAGEKTYACFVKECDKVCSEWQKRRSHLKAKHGFPANYDFLVVNHGIDRQRSLLRAGIDENGHRKSSRERGRSDSSVTEATQTTEATSVDDPDESVSLANMDSEIASTHEEHEVISEAVATKSNVDELASSFSALKMVPRSVTFGRRKGRSGLARS